MTSDIDQLRVIRSYTLAQLQELRAQPKPTYWIDNQRVHWEEYAESLQRTVDWCDARIADAAPFQVRSQGDTT